MNLLIVFLLGIFFIIGFLIIKFVKNTKTIEILSISIALGTMASLIVIELIPEMLEHMEGVNIFVIIALIIAGILILKLLDLFVPEHDHEHTLHHDCSESNLTHIGIVSLIAIILHNIIEGMAVYSILNESFKTSYLKNQETFEKFIKMKYDPENDIISYEKYEEITGVHVYHIKVTNKKDNTTTNAKVIMNLKDNRDFEISFSKEV